MLDARLASTHVLDRAIALKATKPALADRHRRAVHGGNAVVRLVAVVLDESGERDFRRCADTEAHGRRETVVLVLHHVARGAEILAERVEPHGGGARERLVDV